MGEPILILHYSSNPPSRRSRLLRALWSVAVLLAVIISGALIGAFSAEAVVRNSYQAEGLLQVIPTGAFDIAQIQKDATNAAIQISSLQTVQSALPLARLQIPAASLPTDPARALSHLTVGWVPNSKAVRIDYVSEDPQATRVMVNSIIQTAVGNSPHLKILSLAMTPIAPTNRARVHIGGAVVGIVLAVVGFISWNRGGKRR